MKPTLRYIVAGVIMLVSGAAASCACADVLLLHNGSLLSGAIVRTESSYAVRDDRGNVRYVARSQVAHRCSDATQAYRWKRRRVDRDDVRGHVRLAQWCLKNRLSHEATDELLHVSSIAPNHGAIRALERQLKNYHRSNAAQSADMQRTANAGVKTVSFNKPVSYTATKKTLGGPQHDLPPKVIAEFKRTVQPILINRCGQIACHGAATKSDFRLSLHRGRSMNREMTIQNLVEVMSKLDRVQVERSKLLKMARTPHGNLRAPAIGTHEFEIYQTMQEWARVAIDDAAQNTVEPAERPSINGFTPAGQMLDAYKAKVSHDQMLDSDSSFDEPIILVDPSIPTGQNAPSEDAEGSVPESPDDVPRQATPKTSPKDPFDPDVFNSRHGKRS